MGRVIYRFKSMEVSFEEAGEKGRRTRMLLGFFTVVETIMIYFVDQIFLPHFLLNAADFIDHQRDWNFVP